MDSALVSLLVCPDSRAPLQLGDAALVDRLNAAIRQGKLYNRAEKPLREPLEAVLVREDVRMAYAVRGDVPLLLVDEGIPLEDVTD